MGAHPKPLKGKRDGCPDRPFPNIPLVNTPRGVARSAYQRVLHTTTTPDEVYTSDLPYTSQGEQTVSHLIPIWKNTTFLIGLSWLLYGAAYFDYPDWDIPISFLMAFSTYLTADRFIRSIKKKDYPQIVLWSIGAWWSIDGVYWLYWSLTDKTVMIREGQWAMSLCLYLLCGFVWTLFDSGTLPKAPHPHPANPALPDSEKPLNGTSP